MTKISLLVAAFVFANCAVAQTEFPQRGNDAQTQQGANPQRKGIQSPETNAKRITNLMKRELGITDKQYDKLYKINLQGQKEEFEQRQAMGMPKGPRPEGMPNGQGGPMGAPGGMPSGGMSGHGGMGGPGGMGGHGGMGPGGMGMSGFSQSSKAKTQEQLESSRQKREKKIKKILGEETYAKWIEVKKNEQERMRKEREKGQAPSAGHH